MMDTYIRPEHFEFLDKLRESGVTNMYDAGPYVQREFGLSRDEARDVLTAWIKTLDRDKTPAERALEAQP